MTAFKNLKVKVGTPLETVGHIRGVEIGSVHRGKAGLAILGIHSNIGGGIYCKCVSRGPFVLFWCPGVDLLASSNAGHM